MTWKLKTRFFSAASFSQIVRDKLLHSIIHPLAFSIQQFVERQGQRVEKARIDINYSY